MDIEEHATLLDALSRGLGRLLIDAAAAGRPYPKSLRDAHAAMLESLQDIWDDAPDLVPREYRQGALVDLSTEVRLLRERPDGVPEESLLANILDAAPSFVRDGIRAADDAADRLAVVERWWAGVDSPVLATGRVARDLIDPRRWKRVHAALELAALGERPLLNASGDDVDDELVAAYLDDPDSNPEA